MPLLGARNDNNVFITAWLVNGIDERGLGQPPDNAQDLNNITLKSDLKDADGASDMAVPDAGALNQDLASHPAVTVALVDFPLNRDGKQKFDDLPTAFRLSSLPASYKHLKFSSFSVFAPHSPLLEDYITPYDLNCAVSLPNALLGSRSSEDGPVASFEIANASAMTEEGLQPYFTLHTLQLKPMIAPEPGTNIWIKGYRKDREEPLSWNVDFPSGYYLPLLVNIEKFSKKIWDGLYKIEIGADFGYDALDWEFCLDDLDLQFIDISRQEITRETLDQKIL